MTRCSVVVVALSAVGALGCSPAKPSNAPDSAAVAQITLDSVLQADRQRAPTLVAAARSDLATLLKNPASATFDSLTVVQPAQTDGRWPLMAVCGYLGGKPGLGSRVTAAAFIYQSKQAVFVEDPTNGAAFHDLWIKLCVSPPGRVITPSP